jgi:hypothetical protein
MNIIPASSAEPARLQSYLGVLWCTPFNAPVQSPFTPPRVSNGPQIVEWSPKRRMVPKASDGPKASNDSRIRMASRFSVPRWRGAYRQARSPPPEGEHKTNQSRISHTNPLLRAPAVHCKVPLLGKSNRRASPEQKPKTKLSRPPKREPSLVHLPQSAVDLVADRAQNKTIKSSKSSRPLITKPPSAGCS